MICFFVVLGTSSCNKKGDRFNRTDFNGQVFDMDSILSRHFKLAIDIKTQDTIPLILYYNDGTLQWFDEAHRISGKINGNGAFQNVIFEFPDKVIPKSLRFDIGYNTFAYNKLFEIGKIDLIYRHKKIQINPEDFPQYFLPNRNIKPDFENRCYQLIERDESGFDPFFTSTEKLNPLLYYLGLK